MAKPIEKQKVQNPFTMGPAPTQMPGRLMRDSTALPRAAFQSKDVGLGVVNALVNFAGVGADLYTKKMNKKIEADKIIQTGAAIAGSRPTDEATVAGYRTHAAVTLKSEMLGSQAKLNELAKQGLTEEEWEKAVQDEYVKIDNYMLDNYHNYTTDQEMQKLVPLSFREAMPQIVSTREANKLEREIESRINHASDSLIGIAKTQAQAGTKVPTEKLTENINGIISGLQLTSSQKDQVVANAILTSRSEALIDASKMWTGDRKTSLYERTGSIQKLEEQLENEAISLEAVALTEEFNTIESNILSGEVTLEAGLDMIDKRNKQLNGKFATRGAIDSIYTNYNKQIAANTRGKRIKQVLSDQQITDASEFKVKERQAGYKGIYTDLITKAQEEAKNVPDEKQGEFLQNKVSEAVARVSDMAVTKDDVVNPFVNVLANLATSNVAARQQVGEKGELTLDSTTKQAIQILDAMPAMAKYKHLEAVGGKEARTIRAFMAYRDRGISEPQALSMAQGIMTNPVPIDYKRVATAVEDVRDNLEFLWKPDFDDNQAAYLESEIRNQVSLSPEPDDESNVDLVTEYFKKGWTTAGSLRLKGSEGYLSRAMMLNGDKIETAMKGVVWAQRDTWLPQIQALGLDEEDVFPITDPKRGTVQIIARSKASNANVYLGKPMPLKDVRKMAAKYKVNQEKKADKELRFYVEGKE